MSFAQKDALMGGTVPGREQQLRHASGLSLA